MENGTIIWNAAGHTYQAKVTDMSMFVGTGKGFVEFDDADFCYEDNNHAPFNDGEYLHYTRFHPQLKDMVGAEGYFYDEQTVFMGLGRLSGVNKDGCPMNDYRAFCYFAVPVESGTAETEKTELTLQEVADKFGVPVEQLRIKE